MKGVSAVVWIVIVIIVMLVAALVVLSIFGGGVTQVATFSEAKTICITQAVASCAATGSLPPTWNAPTVKRADQTSPESCKTILPSCECSDRGTTGCE